MSEIIKVDPKLISFSWGGKAEMLARDSGAISVSSAENMGDVEVSADGESGMHYINNDGRGLIKVKLQAGSPTNGAWISAWTAGKNGNPIYQTALVTNVGTGERWTLKQAYLFELGNHDSGTSSSDKEYTFQGIILEGNFGSGVVISG